jgi:hypothetical protein
MRATPGEMSTCALETTVKNPSEKTGTRKFASHAHLIGKTSPRVARASPRVHTDQSLITRQTVRYSRNYYSCEGIRMLRAGLTYWTCQERVFNSTRLKNWPCRCSISCTTSCTGSHRIAKKVKTWFSKAYGCARISPRALRLPTHESLISGLIRVAARKLAIRL